MNNRVIITTAAIVLAVFTGGWLGLAFGPGPSSSARLLREDVPLSQTAQSAAPTPAGAYLVREYNGKVAVFVDGAPEPGMILDVYVSYLPEADRRQLETGVPVEDYQKLVRLLEDYAS